MIHTAALPYYDSAADYFRLLRSLPYPIWLDSQSNGRWDILVADPIQVISCSEYVTRIQTNHDIEVHEHDPLRYLKALMPGRIELASDYPFVGGLIGFMSYDFGRYLEPVMTKQSHDYHLPDLLIGLYDWAVLLDHELKKATLVSAWQHPSTQARWSVLVTQLEQVSSHAEDADVGVTDWASNLSEEDYAERFWRIKRYLTAGDCYQVNLAQRFSAELLGDPFVYYCQLRQRAKAPFGAYLDLGTSQILSCSPEQFLEVAYPKISTKPIKGTRPRGKSAQADRALKNELANSEKDQAENVMIVDLLRNDLSKICQPRSVQVPHLFAIESYENVHHMVTTIVGTLKEGMHPLDALWHCFPGGSITGAPKYHVMEIIEELEPNHRSIYCGSVFYIGYDWQMNSNITIRTMLHEAGQLYCWAGGGIVMDSELGSEYQETFDKVMHLCGQHK